MLKYDSKINNLKKNNHENLINNHLKSSKTMEKVHHQILHQTVKDKNKNKNNKDKSNKEKRNNVDKENKTGHNKICRLK